MHVTTRDDSALDLDRLTVRVVERGVEYTIVRPGIVLCLFFAEPALVLAPAVADILEAYVRFIPPGALQSFLAADGTWKKATRKTFTTTLGKLRAIRAGEYAEFHLGQEPLASVGQYGAHFKAGPLADDFFPLEDCVLYLEFPADPAEVGGVERLVGFVEEIVRLHPFDSGHCGFAFKHLHMTFRREAFKAIGAMAMRYMGFDVQNDYVRKYARHRIANVSWLTLLGNRIVAELGGTDALRDGLADVARLTDVGAGVMVRASERPIVADVNRGATDAGPLRRLATVTRALRVEVANLGPDDPTFAERWLGRFDD